MEISKEFTFEAAHMLPKHNGKCARLHGHSWKLIVTVRGAVDSVTGFVEDYAELKRHIQPLIDDLDHRFLGAWTDLFYKPMLERHQHQLVPGLPIDFYPSSENLIVWIAEELDRRGGRYVNEVVYFQFPYWCKLELKETCTSSCVLTRDDYENRAKTGLGENENRNR